VDDRAAAERERAVAADHQVQAQPSRCQQEIGRSVGTGRHEEQRLRPGRNDESHRFSGEKNGSAPASWCRSAR
jgi:hypothetical protein